MARWRNASAKKGVGHSQLNRPDVARRRFCGEFGMNLGPMAGVGDVGVTRRLSLV